MIVAKTIFYSLAALVRKILFCHSKIKFISSHHRVISCILRFASNSGDLGYIASGEEVRSKETVILSSVGD